MGPCSALNPKEVVQNNKISGNTQKNKYVLSHKGETTPVSFNLILWLVVYLNFFAIYAIS